MQNRGKVKARDTVSSSFSFLAGNWLPSNLLTRLQAEGGAGTGSKAGSSLERFDEAKELETISKRIGESMQRGNLPYICF